MNTERAQILSIDDVIRESRLSRTAVFGAMRRGDLAARKYGRRTLITRADLEAFIQAMPLRSPQPDQRQAA